MKDKNMAILNLLYKEAVTLEQLKDNVNRAMKAGYVENIKNAPENLQTYGYHFNVGNNKVYLPIGNEARNNSIDETLNKIAPHIQNSLNKYKGKGVKQRAKRLFDKVFRGGKTHNTQEQIASETKDAIATIFDNHELAEKKAYSKGLISGPSANIFGHNNLTDVILNEYNQAVTLSGVSDKTKQHVMDFFSHARKSKPLLRPMSEYNTLTEGFKRDNKGRPINTGRTLGDLVSMNFKNKTRFNRRELRALREKEFNLSKNELNQYSKMIRRLDKKHRDENGIFNYGEYIKDITTSPGINKKLRNFSKRIDANHVIDRIDAPIQTKEIYRKNLLNH